MSGGGSGGPWPGFKVSHTKYYVPNIRRLVNFGPNGRPNPAMLSGGRSRSRQVLYRAGRARTLMYGDMELGDARLPGPFDGSELPMFFDGARSIIPELDPLLTKNYFWSAYRRALLPIRGEGPFSVGDMAKFLAEDVFEALQMRTRIFNRGSEAAKLSMSLIGKNPNPFTVKFGLSSRTVAGWKFRRGQSRMAPTVFVRFNFKEAAICESVFKPLMKLVLENLGPESGGFTIPVGELGVLSPGTWGGGAPLLSIINGAAMYLAGYRLAWMMARAKLTGTVWKVAKNVAAYYGLFSNIKLGDLFPVPSWLWVGSDVYWYRAGLVIWQMPREKVPFMVRTATRIIETFKEDHLSGSIALTGTIYGSMEPFLAWFGTSSIVNVDISVLEYLKPMYSAIMRFLDDLYGDMEWDGMAVGDAYDLYASYMSEAKPFMEKLRKSNAEYWYGIAKLVGVSNPPKVRDAVRDLSMGSPFRMLRSRERTRLGIMPLLTPLLRFMWIMNAQPYFAVVNGDMNHKEEERVRHLCRKKGIEVPRCIALKPDQAIRADFLTFAEVAAVYVEKMSNKRHMNMFRKADGPEASCKKLNEVLAKAACGPWIDCRTTVNMFKRAWRIDFYA